jgi:glyoxylase-like metal-dependent hydrolase (beta-lactamase superfamily II)
MPELRRLAKGVYAFLQPPLVWYSSAGVVVGERDVIVIDSLTNAAMTGALLAEIRRVTDEPIRFLINTHSHADHVYTNHLFPEATLISTHRCREHTAASQQAQAKHATLFARLFPDVDFEGGRYTLQDLTFSGSLTFHQGEREVRVIELGVGHSESDVIVHLPQERIVFCGDLFMNAMPPLPGRGTVSQTIANCLAIEALQADVYVAGHGDPGTLADVRAQREQLESRFQQVRGCFERGLSYDAALKAVVGDETPRESERMTVLYSYCELAGQLPESADPASRNHMDLLHGIAAEARLAREEAVRAGSTGRESWT